MRVPGVRIRGTALTGTSGGSGNDAAASRRMAAEGDVDSQPAGPAVLRGNPDARLWSDFDNTLAALKPQVDWAASRRELEAYLRSEGVGDSIFTEFAQA